MDRDLPRLVDRELDECLSDLPAIALEGPKGVDKTVTAVRRAKTVFEPDRPSDRFVCDDVGRSRAPAWSCERDVASDFGVPESYRGSVPSASSAT